MSELTEIRDHLAHFAPFATLPGDLLDRVAGGQSATQTAKLHS